jgi:TolA-binding protein
MAPELDSARSKIKKLEQQLASTESLFRTLQCELSASEQVRQALNSELKRMEQALSSAAFSPTSNSADPSQFVNALQWTQVGDAAGWSIRRRVHVDACVWALVCSGNFRFWMAETDLMRRLGEQGVSVGSMFDALPPPIVLDSRDHAAANVLKEKQIEIVSLEKKVHDLTNELQKLQIKSWVQPQHESSDFPSDDGKRPPVDECVLSPPEVEIDCQQEADRLVLLVADLERKLAGANSNHAKVVASLRSELEAVQAKVAEADATARDLLLATEKQLEQQFRERIEEVKRKSRVIRFLIPVSIARHVLFCR